MFKERTVLGF